MPELEILQWILETKNRKTEIEILTGTCSSYNSSRFLFQHFARDRLDKKNWGQFSLQVVKFVRHQVESYTAQIRVFIVSYEEIRESSIIGYRTWICSHLFRFFFLINVVNFGRLFVFNQNVTTGIFFNTEPWVRFCISYYQRGQCILFSVVFTLSLPATTVVLGPKRRRSLAS